MGSQSTYLVLMVLVVIVAVSVVSMLVSATYNSRSGK